MSFSSELILYKDQDFIVLNKTEFQPVVPDKQGDRSLLEELLDAGLIKKDLGPVQRLDRPVRGVIMFARTEKGLKASSEMIRNGKIKKTYLAVLEKPPREPEGRLTDYLMKQRNGNKSRVVSGPGRKVKKAILDYRVIGNTERYTMVKINLVTGRHHQIRVQLSHRGCPIKGDVKYGARRSNKEGGIMLFSRQLEFDHPFSGEHLNVKAPLPEGVLWDCFPDNI